MKPPRLPTALVAAILAGCAPAPASTPPGSDIGVRGHWVVTVLDATGEEAARHEFDNAYTDPSSVLQQLLAGEAILGGWGIHLGSPSAGQGVCDDGGTASTFCYVFPPGVAPASPNLSPNLVVSTSGPDVVLRGSILGTYAGAIDRVRTVLHMCAPDTVDCDTGWSWTSTHTFTEHVFTAPDVIAVAAGQQVKVDVTISFANTP